MLLYVRKQANLDWIARKLRKASNFRSVFSVRNSRNTWDLFKCAYFNQSLLPVSGNTLLKRTTHERTRL